MKVRILSGADVLALVDMRSAIEAMREAFSALSTGRGDNAAPPRAGDAVGDRALHARPPADQRRTAAKVVTVHPGNAAAGCP